MELRTRADYNIKANPVAEWAVGTSCADGTAHFNSNLPTYPTGDRRVMADYVVPRFHARSKAGEKFFNNMYSEKVTVTSVGAPFSIISVANSCNSPVRKAQYWSTGNASHIFIPKAAPDSRGNSLPLLSSALSDPEILRLRKEISTEVWAKRGMSDTDIWEAIAEYRQTLSLLSGHLEKLKSLSKRVADSASRSQTGRGLFKEVSDGYLMYRYGISPTLRDIQNLLNSLTKGTGHKQRTVRASGQISAHKTITGSVVSGVLTGAWVNQVADAVTVRAMSLDEVDISFANNLGFSTRGMLLLPWQLTTYSFVADWFANIGSFIASTLPAPGFKQLGHALVMDRVIGNGYTVTVQSNNAGYTLLTAPNGTNSIVHQSKQRTGLEPAAVVVKSDFRFDDFTRVTDAVTLLASRFGGLSKTMGSSPNNSAFRDKKAYHAWASQPGIDRH